MCRVVTNYIVLYSGMNTSSWFLAYDSVSAVTTLFVILFLAQLPATLHLMAGLRQAVFRYPHVGPPLLQATTSLPATSHTSRVSIIVPTLNEAHRLTACLTGLIEQNEQVGEILVVDSNSNDGTQALVRQFQQRDPRLTLITDEPLPPGWVGRPWALQCGFLLSSSDSEWILGIDADTEPDPNLVQSLVAKAEQDGYDLVSLSPRFIMRYPGETWLHPALLITLLYRTTFSGTHQKATHVLANGQCFLCRRSVLATINGYTSARSSFCDDVTLARNVAKAGYKVGLLDGARLLKVRMYEGAVETWQGWGRSLDLKDAASPAQLRADLYLLTVTQALPLPILVTLLTYISTTGAHWQPATVALFGINGLLLLLRVIFLFATEHCFDRSQATAGWLFWLSPLLDPVAVLRVFLSSFHRPTQWRGRTYYFPPEQIVT